MFKQMIYSEIQSKKVKEKKNSPCKLDYFKGSIFKKFYEITPGVNIKFFIIVNLLTLFGKLDLLIAMQHMLCMFIKRSVFKKV